MIVNNLLNKSFLPLNSRGLELVSFLFLHTCMHACVYILSNTLEGGEELRLGHPKAFQKLNKGCVVMNQVMLCFSVFYGESYSEGHTTLRLHYSNKCLSVLVGNFR